MKLPQRPPDFDELLKTLGPRDPQGLGRLFAASRPVDHKGRYLHWDEMRNRTPPEGLSHEDWWLATKLARGTLGRNLPLLGTDGRPFGFCNVDQVQEMVHRIDQRASGQILAEDVVTNLRSSDRYLVSSLAEEAITSSQLEGASTTRRVAKDLLASGRRPRDRSEQMIVGNLKAMLFAQELSSQSLTQADVLDLHRVVAGDALDDPTEAGRLQTPDDDRIGIYWHDNTLLHRPPPAAELPARLEAMCRFANGESSGEGFVHPVVRAIIVHFWLAYDHPFADGNWRVSRALFYWAMLHQGYWLAQYLSVSSILRKAPARYATSYLRSETDDNDLTYFVIYQLEVVERAIESLHAYLGRKVSEAREVEALLHASTHLNHRQMVIVRDALRDPTEAFTIKAQTGRHRVTYETARSDLLGLETLGLLAKEKVGKKFLFRPVADLRHRLQTRR